MSSLWITSYWFQLPLIAIICWATADILDCDTLNSDCNCKKYANTINLDCHTPNLSQRLLLELSFKDNNSSELRDVYMECLSENTNLDVNILPDLSFRKLKTLKIKNCLIKEFSNALFSNLSDLILLDISDNYLQELSHNFLSPFKNVRKINLANCQLQNISKDLFKDTKLLEEVNLSQNQIITLPDEIFANLVHLKNMTIEYSHLMNISETIFYDCTKLRYLNLKGNNLHELPETIFFNLTELTTLDLSLNKLSFSTGSKRNDHFNKCDKLLKVNMSFNGLVDEALFENCLKLEEIDLSYNNITIFPDYLTISFLDLKMVNLSNNNIMAMETTNFQFVSKFNVKLYLRNNNISEIDLRFAKVLDDNNNDPSKSEVYLDNNFINCDSCNTFYLVMYFRRLTTYKFVHLRPERLRCTSTRSLDFELVSSLPADTFTCLLNTNLCPETCVCKKRPYDETYIIDCAFKNLTRVPVLNRKMTNSMGKLEVHLEANYLSTGPTDNMGYDNVTSLYLFENKIERLEWIPFNIQVLELHNNKLTNLNYTFLDILNSSKLFSRLSLHGNPWECNCLAVNLTNFLRKHNTKILHAESITCSDNSTILKELNESNLCYVNKIILLSILMVLALLALIVAVMYFVFYRFNRLIKAWLFKQGLCLDILLIDNVDNEGKFYDVFVSYSRNDEEFVLNELVSTLEGGPKPFKLCLQYREGLAGEMLVDEIPRLMKESKMNLVVLSNNYLENVWNHHEFRAAQFDGMLKGDRKVVIIIYGDLNLNNLDQELDAYLKMNTYVKWGDPYFWMKLNYALPHHKILDRSTSKSYISTLDNIQNIEFRKIPSSPTSTKNSLENPLL